MRLIDRMARAAYRVGLGRRSTALIETTGRKSGAPRVTPVTNGLDGDVFWIVTDEDPQARLERIVTRNSRTRSNAQIVRKTATEHLVIRVDLDPRDQ